MNSTSISKTSEPKYKTPDTFRQNQIGTMAMANIRPMPRMNRFIWAAAHGLKDPPATE